ncbi:MAG: IS4 family transposase [Moorea sp. SIO3C2]|nr:IS4 family transposase [Moorena sp. SIO3C2]
MLSPFYQTILRKHLSESQYLTLELLLLLIQSHHTVRLSTLASVFPQPIKKESRKRNLQRFLVLPQLSIKLLWFPLIKYWIRQIETGKNLNHQQRRKFKRLRRKKRGFWVIAIDRTKWRGRNMFVAVLIWGQHALPLCYEEIGHDGNSNLAQQKRLLRQALSLFKNYPVLVLGDREFHSPKLGQWLDSRGVKFCLRQKKNLHFKTLESTEYEVLSKQGFKPGKSKFYRDILCNKTEGIGHFNLAAYWKRKYRNKAPKDPWYILTNLSNFDLTLKMYRSRWGIEQMFKDTKTSGYNLEDTKVNDIRFRSLFLLVMIAYTFTTIYGQELQSLGISTYAGRVKEVTDKTPRTSDFRFGLYGYAWIFSMDLWADFVLPLLALKSHKRLYFQRGFNALSLMRQAI